MTAMTLKEYCELHNLPLRVLPLHLSKKMEEFHKKHPKWEWDGSMQLSVGRYYWARWGCFKWETMSQKVRQMGVKPVGGKGVINNPYKFHLHDLIMVEATMRIPKEKRNENHDA